MRMNMVIVVVLVTAMTMGASIAMSRMCYQLGLLVLSFVVVA